jgi:hypothetical protein
MIAESLGLNSASIKVLDGCGVMYAPPRMLGASNRRLERHPVGSSGGSSIVAARKLEVE